MGSRGEKPSIRNLVGMGMVPRGEVGIVAAQLGLAMKALNQNLFSIVLFMAVATTLIAPPFLRKMLQGHEITEEGYVTEEQPFRVE